MINSSWVPVRAVARLVLITSLYTHSFRRRAIDDLSEYISDRRLTFVTNHETAFGRAGTIQHSILYLV